MEELILIAQLVKQSLVAWNTHQARKYLKEIVKYERTLKAELDRGSDVWDKSIVDHCRWNIMLISRAFLTERQSAELGSVPK